MALVTRASETRAVLRAPVPEDVAGTAGSSVAAEGGTLGTISMPRIVLYLFRIVKIYVILTTDDSPSRRPVAGRSHDR